MIKTADLKAQTRRELADLAKHYGIQGWHGMRKHELVDAIKKVQRRLRRKSSSSGKSSSAGSSATAKGRSGSSKAAATAKKNGAPSGKSSSPNKTRSRKGSASKTRSSQQLKAKNDSSGSSRNPSSKSRSTGGAGSKSNSGQKSSSSQPVPEIKPPRVSAKTARVRAQIRKRRESIQRNRDLSTGTLVGGSAVKSGSDRTRADEPHSDRVVLLVRDSYWLQASWEITRSSVRRAQSALAERWHTATPTLRLLSVGEETSNGESIERDVRVHGGVNNWYIDVDDPPSRFRVMVGYLTDNGEFYSLCRSNVVETPRPGECERLDEHWRDIAEDYERIYSLSGGYETNGGDLKEMFEERLHRTMPLRGEHGRTVADPALLRQSELPFEVDAELIVFGKTSPGASVMVAGRPVKLQADGSFTVRMKLPDKRQVLPVTAESRDGLRQRTTVVAVERNTKVMEPVELEDNF